MSRQAGPSIVLSVLIVCFFAVALFQRDSPRARVRAAAVAAREAVARTSAPTPASTAIGPNPARCAVTQGGRSKQDRRLRPATARSNRVDRAPAAAARIQAPEARRLTEGSPPRSARIGQVCGFNRAPAKGRMAGRRNQSRPVCTERPSRLGSERSAFTTARESETIEDVSARIYGSPEHGRLALAGESRHVATGGTRPCRRGCCCEHPT